MNRATFFIMMRTRHFRLLRIALLHLAIVALSIGCDGKRYYDIDSGDLHLRVPKADGSWANYLGVEFNLADEVSEGVLEGWVTADGCQVEVAICSDGDCQMAFRAIVPPGDEVYFEESSYDNHVFDHYVGKFDGSSDPLCSCAGRQKERHTMGLRLQSDLCPAHLEALVGLDLIEEDEYY